MRSNKLRLAALAMSFVMAATAVPSVAFAEDLFTSDEAVSEEVAFDDGAEFVEEPVVDFVEPEAAEEEFDVAPVAEVAVELKKENVRFYFGDPVKADYTVEYTPTYTTTADGHNAGDPVPGYPKTLTATDGEKFDATCFAGPTFTMKVTIPDFGEYVSEPFPVAGGEKLKHQWEEVTVGRPDPGCETTGVYYKDWYCPVCQKYKSELPEEGYIATSELAPATGHTLDTTKEYTTKYEVSADTNSRLGDDDKPTYIKANLDWSYFVVTEGVCKVCGKKIEVDRQEVKKEGQPVSMDPRIENVENIAVTLTYDASSDTYIKESYDRVQLTDCDKPGVYNVVVDMPDPADATKTIKTILHENLVIPAHHVADEIQIFLPGNTTTTPDFKCSADPNVVVAPEVKYLSADKTSAVTIFRNKGEELSVTGLSCKTPVVYRKKVLCVNPTTGNKHVISDTKETAELGPHKIDEAKKKEIFGYVDETTKQKVKGFVELQPERFYSVATDDAAKAGNLAYVVKDLHINAAPKDDDNKYVDVVLGTATCTTAGTVILQFRCRECDKVIEELPVELTKALGHVPAEPVAENYVAPTCEGKGSFDSVVYCTICKAEISRRKVTVPAAGHKYLSDPVAKGGKDSDENVVLGWDGTGILVEGNHKKGDTYAANFKTGILGTEALNKYAKLVVKDVCTVCGKTKTTTKAITSAKITNIAPGENYCEEKQLTVEVTYKKTKGDKELLKTPFTFPYYEKQIDFQGRTPHDPAPAVHENIVPATETKEGSYDSVVYCRLCGHEISRTPVVEPVATHVHDWKKVDAKEATCTEPGNKEYYFCEACGSYSLDGVETCAQNETVIAAEHKYEQVEEVPATCTEAGVKAHVICSVCGKKKIIDEEAGVDKEVESDEELVIEALGHELEKVEAKAPTATEEGNIEYYTCTRCGKFFSDAEGTTEITEEETKIAKLELPAKVTGVKTNAYPSDVYPSKGFMKVTWTAVEGADDYRVSYRALGETAWTKVLTGGANSITLDETALTVGTSYEIRVAAGKEGVFGPRSDVLRRYYESVTPKYTKTSDSITVSWPAVEKGSSYMVIYSENKSMKPYKTIIVRNGILTATLKNLKAGTKYYVRVRPYDKTGKTATGALSPLKCVTTKK